MRTIEAILVLAAWAAGPAGAAPPVGVERSSVEDARPGACTEAEAAAAELAVPAAGSSWAELHAQYIRYAKAGCDGGALAEGWTAAVVHLLAHHWARLPTLAQLAQDDPGFRQFVVKHIDASADRRELEAVAQSATSSCPPLHARLCKAVERAARAASPGSRRAGLVRPETRAEVAPGGGPR